MTIIGSIEAIRNGLKTGRFANEASVSQGIVLRLLNDLSWQAYDTNIVWPEYSLKGRRVDFALCHPPGKPMVFIEVKQVGQAIDAERQLFEYAFHEGIPLAILTTGQEWHFFLPAERGDYGERRVYKLDLLEREPAESAARLNRYLEFGSIASGEAIEAARADYRSIARSREIDRTLPEAWRKLIDESDEILVELVAEKVESLCGFRPEPQAVWAFLSGTVATSSVSTVIRPKPRIELPATKPKQVSPNTNRQSPRSFFLEILGDQFGAETGRDLFHRLFVELDRRDSTFLERFANRSVRGREKRPYLARDRYALYPGSEHIADVPSNCREVRPGSSWWLDLHLSYRSMERITEIACEVAGLNFGTAVKIRFP